MECNKDEAIRGMEIAEKKMETNDFDAARRIARKAQSIYPELENISQLITVCDVHCSSIKRVFGSEKDWYEILQIEKLADETTIKKQYRRLALFLHPDKNRFPGAEAAFKLICEANAVLSDPTKKSLYDNKIRVSSKSVPVYPPRHHMNKTFQFHNTHRAQNSVSNGFTNLNLHQAAGSSSSFSPENFWTSCPFCSFRYKYPREYANRSIMCRNCSKNFMACEIGSQGISLGSKWGPDSTQHMSSNPSSNQPSAFQEKGGNFKVGAQIKKGFSSADTDLRSNTRRRAVQREQGIRTGSVSVDARPDGTSNGDTVNRESGDIKSKGGKKDGKRRRKQTVESSESFDTSSESDVGNASGGANFNDSTVEMDSEPNGAHFPRRSTRKRQHVVYNESDDDHPSPTEGSQARKLPKDIEKEPKEVSGGEGSTHGIQNSFSSGADYSKSESDQMGTIHPERKFQDNGANHDEEAMQRRKSGVKPTIDADTVEVESDSDQDPYSGDNSNVGVYHCPDTEFHNFDNDRDERTFCVNQIWACYDDLDSMPRFYAKVKEISRSPFKLKYTWLEADLKDEATKKCREERLPISCGCFRFGTSETTSSRLLFSHQMGGEKGQRRGSLIIYPQEGETWALFSNRDRRWSSDPENRQFKYEIVEVLSNFVAGAGVEVVYLDKITGFVSLFQRTSQSKSGLFLVGPNELYKFSHRVPCHKMKGGEREGVPEGSFELDPASLPMDPKDLYYPSKADMEPGTSNVGSNGQQNQLKKGVSAIPEGKSTPKEFVELEDSDNDDV
ncbi:hypothetical protein F511_17628 [Dorcoceras hygrometricum]|uniref:J domain-containing protein n=1 Tax=Dorcoceras hygrometricum TaxID=472368 RepID=A0A2Z7AIR7_9LAMI|nr:hypothetical protein F511_17628 [Dorcoceras hygrometricum]